MRLLFFGFYHFPSVVWILTFFRLKHRIFTLVVDEVTKTTWNWLTVELTVCSHSLNVLFLFLLVITPSCYKATFQSEVCILLCRDSEPEHTAFSLLSWGRGQTSSTSDYQCSCHSDASRRRPLILLKHYWVSLRRLLNCGHWLTSSCQGPAVVHVCSPDRCSVRRVGETVLPLGDCLLHLCTHPTDEAQPLVIFTALAQTCYNFSNNLPHL